ncbi:MAG: hypothetical protein SWO11_10735 [Thermodesulfobacteriota bacterium]|nr:hypothetical protein [Thermodesulfobacteriota bacterium]
MNINKKLHGSLFVRGAIGFIGFILSPLSWWNDLFVNFPLAFGFAWFVGKFLNVFFVIHSWLFINLFIGGYFLTNLIGFLMIHYSIFGLKKENKGSVKKQMAISLVYTLLIIAFFGLNICNPEKGCEILPVWVVP